MKARREMVNHPQHYNEGMVEAIDAIEGLELPFLEGTIVKYVARHGLKLSSIQDLFKAQWYLNRLIAKAKRKPLTMKQKQDMRIYISNLLLDIEPVPKKKRKK